MQTTGEQKSVLRGLFAGTALAVLSLTMSVFAAPVPIERVQKLAGGIASSVQVSRSSGAVVRMAQAVSPAEAKVSAVSPVNAKDAAFYVIDRGSTGGFVVLSADDRLDPVLVIAPTGSFDSTPGTPLYDMLCGDVRKRVADADASGARQSEGWRALLDETDPLATAIAYAGVSSIDDVRVEPLVQSKWDQSTVGGKKVYNYYTPNGYVCGCVATAGSQIMRFHRCPTKSVTPVTHRCWVGGVATSMTMYGGTYDWNNMPLVPTSSISDTECEAIGKLTYDLGVAVYMSWASGGSGTGGYCLKDAFLDVFGYKNAMAYQLRSGTFSGTAIENALLANFDAGYPVELGIDGSAGGHSIVGDGYGYSSGSLYVHLNLGWGGGDDAWYHLPNIGTWAGFNVVDGAVYNIFPDGTGDLLTGRVLDASSGEPISGATVQALDGSSVVGSTTTSATGIYALRLPGNKTYSVVASASGAQPSEGSVYLQKSVTTGTSEIYYSPGTGTIGNSWGNDFALTMSTEPVAPTAPTGVSASDGTSTAKIRITWNASSGATDYKIYRNTSDSSASAKLLASSVKTSYYDDTTAEVGTTYYYWVVAHNSIGDSEYSASDYGWRAYAVPDAPTGVSATDGTRTDGVAVTWNSVSGATSYSVWRSDTSSSASASCLMNGITETSYTDTTAVEGKTYWYWVKATSQGGTSAFSASDTGSRKVSAPPAPTGVKASDGLSSTEIVVSWTAVASAASYSVWRSESSSSGSSQQLTSGLTTTSYADTSAVVGKTYYYWVKATNVGGTSDFSASDTGYLANISGPTNVSASDGAYAGFVRISWTAPQNASSYEVWRGTVNAYSLAEMNGRTTSTSYDDTTAQPGMRYYYWVKAITTGGASSAFSASDVGYRPLSVPTGVTATKGNTDGVTVNWSGVTGATSYQIGRGAKGASAPTETLGSATSLSYMDTTAIPGVEYDYFVRAVASACTSDWSKSATGSRSVPTPENLTASDGTYTDRILVTWPALSGATNYELMRASEDDIAGAELIATTTSTSYSDKTAEYGLTYYYFLRAKFAAGTSSWSDSAAGRRAFPAPTGVSAEDGMSTANITITWDEIEGVVQFQIWRYSMDRGRNELIGTSTTTSYKDISKDIEPGIKYAYCVKAVFATGSSALSTVDTGYLKASSPTVSATDGTSTSQISLTWSAMSGAKTYLVYRSATSSSAKAEQIGSTSMLYYNDTSAAKGTLYYYWVRTATAVDTSDFGTFDTGYIGLPSVSRVTASDGAYDDKVVVSWSAVTGAQGYEIWRGTSDDYTSCGKAAVAKVTNTTSWEDTGVTPGVKNWYWVRARDAGVGLWGASDSGYRTLAAPADVTASTTDPAGVKVSWKGTTTGVSFEILRGVTDDRSQADVIATISDKGSYTDNTTVPGYVYYYWVRAYSELSESAWSSSVSGFRAVAKPATVSATDGTSLDSVTITWTAATSAKRYEVWRNITKSTTGAELIGATNKLVWTDRDVEPGAAYYYAIKSVSALDTSVFSDLDLGYASTPAPTGVTASDGIAPNLVRISWTASEGAVSYAVWRAESEESSAATQVKADVKAATYDDTTVVPGKFYWYWVRPTSAAGQGVFAGPDCGFALLPAPTSVKATSDNATRVTVSWLKSNGATSYEIFRAETNDLDFATNTVYATVTTTTYGDTNTVPAVKYWYWVRAVAEADVSPLAGPADGYRLLTAPTGVLASDGTSDAFVKVTWNEAWGATSYEIWRAENSTSATAASLLTEVTNALEYIDVSASAGISYTYWVKAVSRLHTTGLSAYDKGWRSHPAPSEVTASDGSSSDGVIIQWNAVDGALKYEVWRNDMESTEGAKREIATADASVCVVTNTSAKPGVRYWFWVRTVSATGTGVFGVSDDGFRAVTAPTNLKATDGVSYDSVRVTWSAATGAESYEVCRLATNDYCVAETNVFTVTGTIFDDTNAIPGVVYSYWARTISPLSTSDYAGPDTGFRKLRPINDVVASDGTSLDAVELSWTVPEGAKQCCVWRSTGTSASAAIKIATVEGSSYADVTALHGVRYYYWVNGVRDVEGEKGGANDGWRGLFAPGDILASDGDSTAHVRITWSASPDATKYQVWRGTSPDPSKMKSIADISSSSSLSYTDTSGTAGTLYYYSVLAGGTGGWSELGTMDTDTGYKALMPPTNVSATDGTLPGQVMVTWANVTGATHYRVYRADSEDGEKVALGGWQTDVSFTDRTCQGTTKYWYSVKAAVDEAGARPSGYSASDWGSAKEGGSGFLPVDWGNGISWPVTDNGDGTATTNDITFTSIENGKMKFSGILGSVGSATTVQTLVKTSLESKSVYTTESTLKIVSTGTAELDLSSIWGTYPSLFVIGISTEKGVPLP